MAIRQTQIAKLAGISDGFLSEILSGRKRPGRLTAARLEKVTGIPFKDWLLSPAEELRAALEAHAGSVVRDNPRGVSEHEAA